MRSKVLEEAKERRGEVKDGNETGRNREEG